MHPLQAIAILFAAVTIILPVVWDMTFNLLEFLSSQFYRIAEWQQAELERTWKVMEAFILQKRFDLVELENIYATFLETTVKVCLWMGSVLYPGDEPW